MTQIERIRYMEQLLDESEAALRQFSDALETYQTVQDKIRKLSEYYTDTSWREDYESDCAGKLPPDLKRGVLSEDAVYDLLAENDRLQKYLSKI